VLFTAAAAHAAEKLPNCFKDSFEGHCVTADVNGQKTVRVTKKTKKLLKEFDALGSRPFGNCSAHYEVPSPIRGGLELRFAWLPEAVAHFGPGAEALVHVYPLEGQSLDTRPELSTAPSVKAGGSSVVAGRRHRQQPTASREIRAHGPGFRIEAWLGLSRVRRPGRRVTQSSSSRGWLLR
jgi:hypothetical protein